MTEDFIATKILQFYNVEDPIATLELWTFLCSTSLLCINLKFITGFYAESGNKYLRMRLPLTSSQ